LLPLRCQYIFDIFPSLYNVSQMLDTFIPIVDTGNFDAGLKG